MSLALAVALSMSIIPAAMRAAPRLALVDVPDARKVHSAAIPRVGGIGIVIGALIPLLLWLPAEPLYQSYLLASIVLFVFGLFDDRLDLGHFVKFAGQFLAVGLLVFYGDLTIERFPFISPNPLHPLAGQAVTFIAMVGMINAANHADGLDGLAGGLTLLSLLAMAALALTADGNAEDMIALAVTGGIIGFLRYNTHPAVVFMGDSGSQFLGLTSGFLAIVLTQQTNPALSPALPALLLGLPVIDILVVLYLRASSGMNWFKATRNHIHHRLLDIGLSHQSTVVIIYSVQLIFVASAAVLRYQSDILILAIYLMMAVALLLAIASIEKGVAKEGLRSSAPRLSRAIHDMMDARLVRRGPLLFLALAVPSYFVAIALTEHHISQDIAAMSALLLIVLLIDAGINRLRGLVVSRAAIFSVAVFAAYLCSTSPPAFMADIELLRRVFFAALAIGIAMALKFSQDVTFRTTTLDYLTLFLVILVALFPMPQVLDGTLAAIVVKSVILFYACEVLLSRTTRAPIPLYAGAVGALAVLAVRGLA